MEPRELSPALLQPQVTVVAILGELLATLPREEETLLECPKRLHKDLKEFAREFWITLHCIDDTWRHHIVTNDDGDGSVTSLSQALAAYRSTPGTTQGRVTMAASKWQWSVSVLVDRWARLARAATELRDTCRGLATKAADRAGIAITQGRELQAQAARDGTALERMGELAQALGGEEGAEVVAGPEPPVREEAMEAASEETRVIEHLEVALGLLERLVAACDEATAFPQELQRLLRDIETTLKGTSMFFRTVPEDLVAKVAVAERLWEANARLAKDHLVGAIDNFLDYYFIGGHPGPSGCGVAKRCQRAIEDIPRLLQPPEHPQRVPEVSPMGTEPQELSPALLQAQVTVVATLGELLDTLPTREEETLLECPKRLHRGLKEFTDELWLTLYCIDDTWRHHIVTNDDGDGSVTSLSQALAAYRSTPGTTQDRVTMAASKWQWSVSVLVDRWARLARAATELRDTCRGLATKAADRAGTATTQGRELQAQAARDGTALERMGELAQALGGEEGAEVVAGPEPPVREEAMEAASEETRVIEHLEVALGLLERLVAACDEATAFPRELQRRVGDIETALKGTNEASPDVPEDLVAKAAEAERLWDANALLARDHLVGAIDDFIDYYFIGGHPGPSGCGAAERCQRAIEDIPRLLRPPEHPQGVPEVSPVSTEPHKLSRALLQPQVTVVSTLGRLLDTLPTQEEEMLLECPGRLHRDLEKFTKELSDILHYTADTWRRQIVTSDYEDIVLSLSQALAAYKSTSRTSRDDVTQVACNWQGFVAVLMRSWARLARKATKLHNTCRDLATRRQRLEKALGLLQRLVTACDEATAFPWELQRLLWDTEATLEETNEASPNVPEDLVAKVAKAERLWEANAHLAEDHLVRIIDDILDFYSTDGRARPSAREVAKRCQRVIENVKGRGPGHQMVHHRFYLLKKASNTYIANKFMNNL